MKSLHSAEMAGLAGKATLCALSMTSFRRISSWLQPSPKGRRPKQHLVQHHTNRPHIHLHAQAHMLL